MKLEVNQKFVPEDRPIQFKGVEVLITPPLDEDYWLARVPLGSNAIVCFPKFVTIGIGFQKETDWNTNLPYSCDAERDLEPHRAQQGRRDDHARGRYSGDQSHPAVRTRVTGATGVNESEAEIRTARELDFVEDCAMLAEQGITFEGGARAGLKFLYERAWTRGAKWANRNAIDTMTAP